MKTPQKKKFSRHVLLPDMCPACQEVFELTGEKIVKNFDETAVLYGACSVCESTLLIFQFGKTKQNSSAIALFTDLTYHDVCAYWAADHITQNDVLDMHTLLENGTEFEKQICAQNKMK